MLYVWSEGTEYGADKVAQVLQGLGLSYSPSKVNMVVDVSSKNYLHMSALMVRELDLIEQFRRLSSVCEMSLRNVFLGKLRLTNSVFEEIRESQKL